MSIEMLFKNTGPEKASLVIEQKPLQNSTKPHLNIPSLSSLENKSLNFLGKCSKPGSPQPQVKSHCS